MHLVPAEILDVKRRWVHLTYASVAVLSGATALYQGIRLHRALEVNLAITDVGHESDAPEVVLARAVALSSIGDGDNATKAFNVLIQRGGMDALGRAALFDLGNLYLRQGARQLADNPAAALPLIELAKQRYRDLLRWDPDDWDARFNLEHALRLAPEIQAVLDDSENDAVERRKMMAPDMTAPDLP